MNREQLAIGFFLAVLFVVFAQAMQSEVVKPKAPPKAGQDCIGEPIKVDYPYQGGLLEPHACKPQCEDKARRYVLYTNGMATQCSELPECLDWGEDNGVTCKPN